MDFIRMPIHSVKLAVNTGLSDREPWHIVTLTTSTVLLSVWLWNFIFQEESIVERSKKTFFRTIRLIPSIRKKLDEEMAKVEDDFTRDVEERTSLLKYITVLPPEGLKSDEILEILNKNLDIGKYDWKGGKVSGSVYYHTPEMVELTTKVFALSSYTNPLHPDVFPGVCKMEAEVVRMVANMFNGGPEACGTMTTGGTESLLMACKAYRDYARETRGIRSPEIVMPVTAHCGFDKAAQYLGLCVRNIPVDPTTYTVNIAAMKRAIGRNTIMLVASAPNFPYGTMDDVRAVAELGEKYGIPVHVDACLGGFIIAFMDKAGYPVAPFDFRLPGITSISADTHKYGCAPKGSSVLVYREQKYRRHQFTVTTDWPGGVYGSPTMSGSRSGGAIAACWAAVLNRGEDGYVTTAREIVSITRYIAKELRSVEGIFIFGEPLVSVVALGSNHFDIYRLSDRLSKLGWNLNVLQFPSGIHLCITSQHTRPGIADRFIEDVRKSVREIMKEPNVPVSGKMAIYGTAQSLPDRSIVGDFTRLFLESMYYTPMLKSNK